MACSEVKLKKVSLLERASTWKTEIKQPPT